MASATFARSTALFDLRCRQSSAIGPRRAPSSRKASRAALVTTIPGGTGTPRFSRRARLAALFPHSATSQASPSGTTNEQGDVAGVDSTERRSVSMFSRRPGFDAKVEHQDAEAPMEDRTDGKHDRPRRPGNVDDEAGREKETDAGVETIGRQLPRENASGAGST